VEDREGAGAIAGKVTMSYGATNLGTRDRFKIHLVAFARFLDLDLNSQEPFVGRHRSAKSWPLVILIAVSVLIASLLVVYFVFQTNHLVAAKLLPLEHSHGLRLKIAIGLLLFEFVVIFAFALQDRRRRKLEALLLQSEDRLEFAAKSADLGLWSWEAATDSFWATTHCNEMLGIPQGAQYTMAAMREAVYPDDRGLVEKALSDGVRSGNTFELEFRMNIGNKQTRWLRCRASSDIDRTGRIARISGTIVDISARKKLQFEIEAQKQSLSHLTRVGMLGELSGALAHELNQPLTAIRSNAQAAQRMLGHEKIDIDELRLTIDDIIANDVRAGEVIHHLRALLKKEDMRREMIDLNDVAREALDIIHSDLVGRRVNVSYYAAVRPAIVTGDPIQLQQLVLNLVLNAAEAINASAHDGGTLTISVETEADDVRHIAVADTGSGIRAELLKNLFDPFVTTKAQGLGLGLSISRSIVEAHDGKIWAENNSGRGATFHVMIPAREETRDENNPNRQ
jgi:C4-dicarboxylate-specific signal transduction histidine kinase